MKEIEKCFEYLEAGDYKSAIKFGKKAVERYPQKAEAYYCLGEAYFTAGEIDRAIENFKKASACLKKEYEEKAKLLSVMFINTQEFEPSDPNLALLYKRLGDAYKRKEDLDTALFYYEKSLLLARDLGFKELEKDTLFNMSDIFYYEEDYDSALECLEEILTLQEDEKERVITYHYIGLFYFKKGEYNEAIRYLKEAIEISERYGDYSEGGMAMLSLAMVYLTIKDYENAEYYLSDGLKRFQKVGEKHGEGMALAFFGLYFRDKGDLQSAREYLRKAYEIFRSIGAEEEAEDVLIELAEIEE